MVTCSDLDRLKNRVAEQIDRMNPPVLNNVLIRVL